jgi:hypothetical protein
MYPVGGPSTHVKDRARPFATDPSLCLIRLTFFGKQTANGLYFESGKLLIIRDYEPPGEEVIFEERRLPDEVGGGAVDEEDQGNAVEEARHGGAGTDATQTGNTAIGTRSRWRWRQWC